MSLYSNWEDSINSHSTQQSQEMFWREYLAKEQNNYDLILQSKDPVIKGKISELAEKYAMDAVTFVGFLDGINTSLESEIDLESLEEETEIEATILWNELYKNMLDVKADWLFNLEAWEGIYSDDERKALKKDFNKSKIVVKEVKIGRNEPCPCGSGKKYKKCCLNK